MYTLELLEGELLRGDYSARRLREFIPREGMELATEQRDIRARQEELGNMANEGENKVERETRVEKEVEITRSAGNRDIA